MLKLNTPSSNAWLQTVLADFDSFLKDHASCEKKASATAMTLVSHYRDRPELVRTMIDVAREELEHFAQVHQLLEARGLGLAADSPDSYVGALSKLMRRGSAEYFLDRLLIAAVVEARGCERFGLIAEHLPPGELRDFYAEFTRSEARHAATFQRLAKLYFEPREIELRLQEILAEEAAIVENLPLSAALH